MRSFRTIVASFILTLACTLLSCQRLHPAPAIRGEQERTEETEPGETIKETSSTTKTAAVQQKDTEAEQTLARREELAKGIIAKQKDVKAEITSAPEEKAATREEIAAEEELMREITGLIIEQTMTKIGYDFYEYFFLFWEPPSVKIGGYNILISERASPSWGSWVTIEVNGTAIWSRVLMPRSEEIEQAAKQAIQIPRIIISATKNFLTGFIFSFTFPLIILT